jgi:hypothetical protein
MAIFLSRFFQWVSEISLIRRERYHCCCATRWRSKVEWREFRSRWFHVFLLCGLELCSSVRFLSCALGVAWSSLPLLLSEVIKFFKNQTVELYYTTLLDSINGSLPTCKP